MDLHIYKGEIKRDFFHLSFFACNYIGFSFRICGFGFTLSYQIIDPKKDRQK